MRFVPEASLCAWGCNLASYLFPRGCGEWLDLLMGVCAPRSEKSLFLDFNEAYSQPSSSAL